MSTEQGVLRVSIAVTVLVAAFGIVFGLLSGSFSIAFDGVYSLADASMSGLALAVTKLIETSARSDGRAGRLNRRFTMGFWHLEPMVLGLNGTLLIGVAVYALINAIISLSNGGHRLEFQFAIVYAVLTLAACALMAVLENRANRRIRSDFIALDAKSWVMSGGITASLLVAFCLGSAVTGTQLDWMAPYVDPAILALVCLIIIPIPIRTIRQALSDILLVTPPALQQEVDRVARETVARHGFVSHRAYVAKVGRARQIELHFIVPRGLAPRAIEEWDRIRDEIGDAIGDESHDRWLTIAFTADAEWAE